MSAAIIRIYCDWNRGIDDTHYDLGCVGSVEDLTKNEHALKEGLRVILYQTAELEAEGVLEFDAEKKRWIGVPDWSTIRYLDGSDDEKKKA
jgi:hypothetical protein